MRKKVWILMIGFLLIGVDLYAAGDLIVNGGLGIGTTPSRKLDVIGNVKILDTRSSGSGGTFYKKHCGLTLSLTLLSVTLV
jgi:hypothetical protein